jgi:sporulation protein YlmC with PRC-barrel domain
MKKRSYAALAAMCAVMMGPAAGQNRTQEDAKAGAQITQSAPPASSQNMYRGSKIIGAKVRDPQDRKLGEVKDIVLDSGRGEVAYVVVSFGGALNAGNRYHAIPWKAMQPSDDGTYYVLHADKETVSKAPAFDRRKWPNMADQKWSSEVDRYWNSMVGTGPPGGISSSSGASSNGTSTSTSTNAGAGESVRR